MHEEKAESFHPFNLNIKVKRIYRIERKNDKNSLKQFFFVYLMYGEESTKWTFVDFQFNCCGKFYELNDLNPNFLGAELLYESVCP